MVRMSLVVVVLSATSLFGACGATGGAGGAGVSRGPSVSATTRSDGCQSVTATPGHAVTVDYVDFVQANGMQYVAHLGEADVAVAPSDVGGVQFLVRCSFSDLNRRTQQMPPPARDGDAGLLPAGTPVHAVNGWSPLCRLVAQHDGSWHVYLALDARAATAAPARCAVTPEG